MWVVFSENNHENKDELCFATFPPDADVFPTKLNPWISASTQRKVKIKRISIGISFSFMNFFYKASCFWAKVVVACNVSDVPLVARSLYHLINDTEIHSWASERSLKIFEHQNECCEIRKSSNATPRERFGVGCGRKACTFPGWTNCHKKRELCKNLLFFVYVWGILNKSRKWIRELLAFCSPFRKFSVRAVFWRRLNQFFVWNVSIAHLNS